MKITRFTAAVGTDDEYDITRLTALDGLDSPGVRVDDDESPRQHGRTYFGALLDVRNITGEWYVGHESHDDFMAERAAAIKAFDPTAGIRTFEVEVDGDTTYQFDAYVPDGGRKMPTRAGYMTAETFRFELVAPKPYLFSGDDHAVDIPVFSNIGGSPLSNVDGVAGNAINLDGTNDYVTVPHNALLNLTGDMSIEAWVYIDTAKINHIVNKVTAGGTAVNTFEFRVNASKKLQFLGFDSALRTITSTGNVELAGWHHVAVVKSGGTATLYIDGVADGSGAVGTTNTNALAMLIGTRTDQVDFFDGQIDELRLYGRALTAAEIISRWADANQEVPSGLIAGYRFNETSGISASDHSGNALTGTLTNGPTWVAGKAKAGDTAGVPIPATGGVPIGGAIIGATDVFNAGDTDAEPTLYIYGPGSTFTLTNTTTGESFVINTTLSATEFIKVIVGTRKVYFGEGTPRDSVFTGDYITLEPGSNIFTLAVGSGSSAATKVTAEYRDTYQGI